MHTPCPASQAPGSAQPARTQPRERLILLALLCLALVHGLIYVYLIPPWDHYDESTHFEYGWWIANRLRLPQEGDADWGMRREVASSMLEHGFYRHHQTDRPDLLPQPEPFPLGVSEFGHPPLYYILIALPLRLVRHTDVVLQLYLGRLVSLLLYLASIAIAYGLVSELVSPGHALRWAVPGAMALVPGYADLMTSVNNDAGAVVAMSLFLWSAVRLIVRGPSVARIAWVLLAAALCVLTKATAAVALLLAPLALALTGRRPALCRRWTWPALLAAGVLALPWLVRWGDAALWVRFTPQRSPTSQRVANAPDGNRVLALEFAPAILTPEQAVARAVGARDIHILQLLPQEDVEALRGVTVTLSAYIWATHPVRVRTPALDDGTQSAVHRVDVDRTPALHVVTATVDAEAGYIQVILRPEPQASPEEPAPEGQAPLVVYYDRVVLAAQDAPAANRVRNGSAEKTWPYLRPAIDRALSRYTRRSLSQFQSSILDWQRTSYIYRYAAVILFQSFWARFGWNHIPLAGGWYWALGVFTGMGAAGAVIGGVRLRGVMAHLRRAIWLLAAAGLLVWINALLRFHPLAIRLFVPVARYAYPAILPTMLAGVAGWLNLFPRRFRRWGIWPVWAALLAIDVVSVWTLWVFHYRR